MNRLPDDLDPELVERLVTTRGGALAQKMEIDFVELSAEHSIARMPVAGNTQVIGLLHGGAHVVLGESLGSISSAIHAGPGRYAVGIEINATHSRSVTEGMVTGTCTALVLGRTLCTHEIVITDDEGHACLAGGLHVWREYEGQRGSGRCCERCYMCQDSAMKVLWRISPALSRRLGRTLGPLLGQGLADQGREPVSSHL